MTEDEQFDEFLKRLSEVLKTNNLIIADMIQSFINKQHNG